MSRAQASRRSFFPFGNPFRTISPKGSHLSPKLLTLLNAFEETLAERMRKLHLKNNDDVLSFAWMKAATELLCEVHNDIKTLIIDLELPVADWDEKWIDVYFDISVKLLDVSIAFSSELTRLSQSKLYVQCAMHKLDSVNPEQFVGARSSLDSWRQHVCSKNQRIENCHSTLKSLVESLDLPKVKNSAKGKVLMRAMYGVKVLTVFVCSVFTSAFSGASNNLLDLDVSDELPWAQAYAELQSSVNGEVRGTLSGGKSVAVKELGDVDHLVKKLYPMIQDGIGPNATETFKISLSDTRRAVEQLSEGMDLLGKEVDRFFKIVMTGRDALLCNLRAAGPFANHQIVGTSADKQAVR